MDPKLQKFIAAFAEFEDVMEKAKKELINNLKVNQQNQGDETIGEMITLKRKLHDERVISFMLNQKISELTEEKNRVELSLELAQESKQQAERQLQEEIIKRKQLELQLRLSAERREEEVSKQVSPASTSSTIYTYEDEESIDHGKSGMNSISPYSPHKRSPYENRSFNSREPSESRMSSSSNHSSRTTKNTRYECYDKPGPACSKRKMRFSSSSSSYTISSQRAAKHRKTSRDSPASTSSTLRIDSELLQESSTLAVPEMYRINYGFSNNYQLDLCPHARAFWYDPLHASSTKYLIRFFDDNDGHWVTKRLTVKEQVGLAEPTVFQLTLTEIVARLEDNIEKPGGIRIFLDVRDWNIFSHNISQFFNNFGSSITHFSVGRHLYSSAEVLGDKLVEFILKNLPNVEFLAFNDTSLKLLGFGFSLLPSVRNYSLQKLKILRLLNVRFKFATPFILAIVLRAPNLSSVYGLPLHLLQEIQKHKSLDTVVKSPWLLKVKGSSEICLDIVKSVGVFRNLYSKRESTGDVPYDFLVDLTTLLRLRPALEELDTRIFFILFIFTQQKRKLCLEKLSEILQLSAHSLKLLRLEPLSDSDFDSLKFHRMELCTTLQLEMKLLPNRDQRYFPRGMELPDFFPSLKSVQIIMDEKSGDGEKHTVQNSIKGKMANDLFEAHFSSGAFRQLDNMKTVEKLNLINFTPLNLMGKFQKLFPHITILCLNQTLPVLSHILPQCFMLWPGLKQLILELTFCSDRETNLDSAFTGIPLVNCKKLENLKAEDVQGRIDKYRNKRAIYSLKDLKLLKFVLYHKGRMEIEMQSCLMTPVSAIYGFGKELMPNLNVIIGFDDRLHSQDRFDIVHHLEPMKDFVTMTIDD